MLNPNLSFSTLINAVPGALALHEAKYQKRLKSIPAPGCGQNCHSSLLGIATLGLRSGRSESEILADIKAAIPAGNRRVDDHEIRTAIKRASLDTAPAGSDSAERPSVVIERRKTLSKTEAEETRKRVLSYSNGPVNLDSDEFRKAHDFQIDPQPTMALHPEAFTMIQLISELYDSNAPLWIGAEDSVGPENIRSAEEWMCFFEEQQRMFLKRLGNDGWNSPMPSAFLMDLGLRFSHLIPNPVSGCEGRKKDGGLSLRCDGSIRTFDYAILDFDDIKKLEDQGEVLHCLCEAMDIRICALIKTGGRNGCGLHALVKIDGVDSLASWNKIVRDGLFPTFEALGADPACYNPSRGVRLSGLFRPETGAWQELLFASREGVKI